MEDLIKYSPNHDAWSNVNICGLFTFLSAGSAIAEKPKLMAGAILEKFAISPNTI